MIRVDNPRVNHSRIGTSTTERISLALSKVCEDVIERQPAHWGFSLTNGQVLKATAVLDEGWLLMHADVLSGAQWISDADRLWSLLQSNASLPGGAKYALDSGGHLGVRAEIPLGEDVDLCGRVWAACHGFKMASERISHEKWSSAETALPQTAIDSGNPDDSPCDLKHMCQELNWGFVERSSGSLVVELDVPNSYYQAMIEELPGNVRLWISLESMASLSSVSRLALGILLLTANHTVRMARATVLERDDNTSAVFEVMLGSRPAAEEINSALSALSIACQVCAREAEVLQDESIAKEFLRLRGCSS